MNAKDLASVITAIGDGQTVTITIPLEISVRVGEPERSSDTEATSGSKTKFGGEGAEPIPPATRSKAPRTASDLQRGPNTFEDPAISAFQSVAEAVARKMTRDGGALTEAAGGDDYSTTMLAAEAVAAQAAGVGGPALHDASAPTTEAMTKYGYASTCASLAWQMLNAARVGNAAAVAELKGHFDGSVCDPRWAETIEEYLRTYGISGDPSQRVYVTPDQAGEGVVEIKDQARIALVGDWGTGAGPARLVLDKIRDQNPDLIVHLGDIYYSGTVEECEEKVVGPIRATFGSNAPPIYTLSGNHDMYCGGKGFFDLIQKLNAGALRQKASFFCLRAPGSGWQFLAMDTGRNDFNPGKVTEVLTFIEPAEEDWLMRRVKEFGGKTVLLSHHQLFSAFAGIGPKDSRGALNPVNPNLQRTYERLKAQARGPIPAWFWGHEHNLCIYEPYGALPLGRCVGHGAIPVPEAERPYDALPEIAQPPRIVSGTQLALRDGFYANGFAMMTIKSSATLAVDYYQIVDNGSQLMYSENIG